MNELADTLQKIVGEDVAPVHLEPRSGDIRYSVADIDKAKRILGYEPGDSFEDDLARPVELFKSLNS